MFTNLRQAFRQFAKSPGFTFLAVLTLAIGIGANTAFFSVVNNTLLRPLPYANQDRLVQIDETSDSFRLMSVSYPNFCDWGDQQEIFSAVTIAQTNSVRLKANDRTEQVQLGMVSSGFLDVLGIKPLLGRSPEAADDVKSAAPVAWITYSTWQHFFAGSTDVIGKSVTIDGREMPVVGVLPASFRFFRGIDAIVPLAPYAEEQFMTMRENHNGAVALALLKPGVALPVAKAHMNTVAQRLQREYPKANSGISIVVEFLHERIAGDSRTNLLLLCGSVATVLLIACVNLANMLLARSFSRAREMAIRAALGATRGQLVRQLLVENLLLAFVGGAAGLLLSLWGYAFVERLVPWNLRPLLDGGSHLDVRVALFSVGITVFTGITFGFAPAWQLSQSSPNDALKQTPRLVNTRWGRWHLRDLLVALQVALALALLVGATLLIRSLQHLLNVDSGLKAANVLTVHVEPPPLADFQKDPNSLALFEEQVLDTARTLPGVESVASVTSLPFSWNSANMMFYVDDQPIPEPGKFPSASNHTVSTGYFQTMGIPILQGRVFDGKEPRQIMPKGVPFTPANLEIIFKGMELQGVVSRAMAERYWPGQNPIGKRFHLGTPELHLPDVEIVGVVGDVTQNGLEQGPTPEFYLSNRQFSIPNNCHLVLRTSLQPSAIANTVRTALEKAFPDNPVTDLRPMADRLEEHVSGRKFNLHLFVFFAATAFLLALIGLYGVLAFVVGQRTREIGIKMALGADRTEVLYDVLVRGLWLVVPGLVFGGIFAVFASRYLQSQLYAITRSDPISYLLAAGLLALSAMAACIIPARRATRVNPLEALRSE